MGLVWGTRGGWVSVCLHVLSILYLLSFCHNGIMCLNSPLLAGGVLGTGLGTRGTASGPGWEGTWPLGNETAWPEPTCSCPREQDSLCP